MAIRMKEWGMLAQPGNGVRLPVQGIQGMDAAARAVGQGLVDGVSGTLSLADAQRRVTATGELAAFSARLHEIGTETRQELAGRDIRDWDYAWNEACSPKLEAAIRELPESARGAAAGLARSFSDQASLEARRDAELGRIGQARDQWKSRVEASVEAGNWEQAREWLEVGRGVFVPEAEMEGRSQAVQSRCCLSGWRKRLQESPWDALAAWGAAEPQPLQEEDRRQWEAEAGAARQQLSVSLAAAWQEALGAGLVPGAAELEMAERAGVISAAQRQESQAPAPPLDAARRCAWMRRIDEREEGEETPLRLQIATAAMPAEDRAQLLGRMDATAGVSALERQEMSRRLWNLYRQGGLGCPGDAMALARWRKLQEQGMPLLAREGAGGVERWLGQLPPVESRWVCFEA